ESKVSKHNKDVIELYQSGVIANKIDRSTCTALHYLQGQILSRNDTQYFTGKWYGQFASRFRKDGASGDFVLYRLTTLNSDFINTYFPKLNHTDSSYNKQ